MMDDIMKGYQVYDRTGAVVLQAAEACRYDCRVERSLLDAGYTIRLNGKRIWKKDTLVKDKSNAEEKQC